MTPQWGEGASRSGALPGDLPDWVRGRAETRWAWNHALSWRMAALEASKPDYNRAYRRVLIREAERLCENATG